MVESEKRYSVANFEQMDSVECSCGWTKRAFVDEPGRVASLHVVQVSKESRLHYHRKMTEIYYVLEGKGQLELDGEVIDVAAGSAVLIRPGCRHRAVGDLTIINIPVPAFDEHDEWFD